MKETGLAQTGVGNVPNQGWAEPGGQRTPSSSGSRGFHTQTFPGEATQRLPAVPFSSHKIYSEKCLWGSTHKAVTGSPGTVVCGCRPSTQVEGGWTRLRPVWERETLSKRKRKKTKGHGPPTVPDNLGFLLRYHKKPPHNHDFGRHSSVFSQNPSLALCIKQRSGR